MLPGHAANPVHAAIANDSRSSSQWGPRRPVHHAPYERMTELRRILSNAGWNLGGNVVPLIAAAALIPSIIARLGVDRFGLLSLAWVLIGYFSLFDLGLGRALTKMIAERQGTAQANEIPSITATAIALMSILGVMGGLLVAACVPLSLTWLDRLPKEVHGEARNSLLLIALGIPLVVGTSLLRSVLEGVQAFRVLNLIRAPAGVLLFAAPALSSHYSPRLDLAILALLVTRVLILIAHVGPCLSHIQIKASLVDFAWAFPMLRFGGWLTVSSVVGPIIVYIDRFVIGAALSLGAVGYYAAPFEVVSRLLVVPMSLATAMFPALVGINQRGDDDARTLRRDATRATLVLTVPLCVFGALVAEPVLAWWLGPPFAEQSTVALQLLLPGLVLNSVAQIPMVALYGHGLTKPVAQLHLIELPIYAALLWWLCKTFGIAGAAMAWSMRAAFDYVALSMMLRGSLAQRRGRTS